MLCVVGLAALSAAGVAGAQTSADALEPNDNRSSATAVTGNGSEWESLTISDAEDEDYFAIEAEAGETITAEMAFSHSEGDLDLELQDAEGTYLTSATSTSDDESISHTVESDGTYYVRAYGFGDATAEYDLSVSSFEGEGSYEDDSYNDGTDEETLEDDALEPNDDRDSAVEADGNASWEGLTISDSNDQDYFAIEADAGETISAEMAFSHDEGDLDLELQDADGEYLTSAVSTTDDESIQYTVDSDGTYYVRAYGYAGATAEYDLSVSRFEGEDSYEDDSYNDGTDEETLEEDALEPNDDRDSAVEADGNASWEGLTISDAEDEDYFAIEADAGETISAEMAFSHDEGDLDLRLEDAAGTYLTSATSTSDDESIQYTVDSDGTYYVRAYGFGDAIAEYDLSVSSFEGEGSYEDDSYNDGIDEETLEEDVLEPNDDHDSAVEANGNASWEGLTISDSNDEDYFAIEADAGETISAEMAFSHSEGDLDLRLEGSRGEYLTSSVSVSDDESVQYTVESDGTYYVRAYGYAGATAEYDLSVSSFDGEGGDDTDNFGGSDDGTEATLADDALESNDDRDSATVVEGTHSEWDSLTISDADDEDYFAIEADAGDTIVAGMQFAHSEGDLDLELQDESGQALTDSISVSDDESVQYTVESDGTYYLSAYGYAGATNEYDFAVNVSSS